MKSELFNVSSTVPVFKRRGADYKDVTIHWYVRDRKAPFHDPQGWIDFATASDPLYSIHALNELFTADEAEQLKEYLMNVHGDDSVKIEAAEKLHDNIIPWNGIAVGGPRDFLLLAEDEGYSLPFKVDGYFDVEQHERIAPEVHSAPPTKRPALPHAATCLPWKKQPGNVIPDELNLPGMEKHRFQLLEYRLNGYESRLQEIESWNEGEMDKLARYAVGLENRLVAMQARLESLESNQSRNPA